MQIFIILLAIGGVVILGGFIYLLFLPGRFEVRISRVMKVPVDKVYERVVTLNSWQDWSPWLMHEPDTKVKYSGKPGEVGSSMSWDGKYVGAGILTHTKIQKNESIESRIDFVRPFRTSNKVGWKFVANRNETEVSWFMSGTMPFFFRFMTKKIELMIKFDYRIGLLKLNRLLDKEAERFQLNFVGERGRHSFMGIYNTYRGSLQDLPKAMHESFTKLFDYVKTHSIEVGTGCVAYWKVNTGRNTTVCDSILPVTQEIISDEMKSKHYPGGRYLLVRYQGNYPYLELAWYAAMSHTRMKKLKQDKRRPSFEVYEKSPMNTKNPDDYVTDLYVPLT